jgi:protein SCO1/2
MNQKRSADDADVADKGKISQLIESFARTPAVALYLRHLRHLRTALLLTLLCFSLQALAADTTLNAGVFDPPRMAPEFTLDGSDGAPLTLSAFRGKIVLLGFGFSSCTQVCPITLTTLAQARKKLGPAAADVQVVYITVDPERDNATRLKQYLSAFDPAFIGGTGTPEQLAAVRREYGILATKQAGPDGAYTHSSFVYLIDRKGSLIALMTYGQEPDAYVHDLKILLARP